MLFRRWFHRTERQPTLVPPKEFAQLIRQNCEAIVEDFVDQVQAKVPAAEGETRGFLKDHLADVLNEIADYLETRGAQKDYIKSAWLANEHALQRAKAATYKLEDLRYEYAILRKILVNQAGYDRSLTTEAYALFAEVFDMSVSHATEIFVRNSVSELLQHQTDQRSSARALQIAKNERDTATNNRDWFTEALNRIPIPLFLLNCESGEVSFSNESAKQILGLDYESFQASAAAGVQFQLVDPQGEPLNLVDYPSQRTIRGETIKGELHTLRTKVGEFQIRVYSEQLPKTHENPKSAIVLFNDISTLRKAETALVKTKSELVTALETSNVKALAERSKFEEVLEQTSIPLALFEGAEHTCVFANSTYRRTFALSEDPVGKRLRDLLPYVGSPDVVTLFNNVYRTGITFFGREVPYSRVNTDGSVSSLFFDVTYAAKRGADEAIEGVLAAVTDVTGSVLSRKYIDESRLRLSKIIDSMPQIVFYGDPEGNVQFNRKWYEYIGWVKGTEGWGWKENVVHHPDDLERTVTKWKHSLETGEPYEINYRVRRHDGQYRWMLGRAVPIRDEEGNIVEWFGTNTDIHDLIEACAELTAAEERLNLALVAAGIGFWDWDAKSGMTILSQTLMEMWGIQPATFRNTLSECLERIHPDDREKVWREIQTSAAGVRKYDVEYRVVRSPNETIFVHAKGESYTNLDGTPNRLTGVVIDVTNRKKFEREIQEARIAADEANAAKSAFLANMSHEIRTPLGAIMGFADLAQQPGLSPSETSSYLKIIQRNSVQVLAIVDDILDLAKVEAGRVELETIDTDLIAFLSDFGSLVDFRARENGIGFELIAETQLPSRVLIDPTRVRQILTNAVGNAIKFTKKGWVRLHVSYRDGLLEFGIADTGRGISAEQAQSLFQAFVQADASTTRKFGGTGLGLVLTKRLCQSMGGDYILRSSGLDAGSHFVATLQAPCSATFKFLLPNQIAFQTETLPISSQETKGRLAGIRVLLVEDSPDNQALLRIILEKQGAIFSLAKDGLEGVAKATSKDFDVVLMDVQMPLMDGHEAVSTLRSQGYAKPVVALTAHAMREEQERALRSGFTDFLPKPVDRSALIELVLRYGSKN